MERSNLGSSCWWRHDPTGGEAVKEPTCDVGGGRLMASFTDPDGNVLGLFTRGSGDQSLIDSFSARRGTEHRLIDNVGAQPFTGSDPLIRPEAVWEPAVRVDGR
jgi:hypothetical protein